MMAERVTPGRTGGPRREEGAGDDEQERGDDRAVGAEQQQPVRETRFETERRAEPREVEDRVRLKRAERLRDADHHGRHQDDPQRPASLGGHLSAVGATVAGHTSIDSPPTR